MRRKIRPGTRREEKKNLKEKRKKERTKLQLLSSFVAAVAPSSIEAERKANE